MFALQSIFPIFTSRNKCFVFCLIDNKKALKAFLRGPIYFRSLHYLSTKPRLIQLATKFDIYFAVSSNRKSVSFSKNSSKSPSTKSQVNFNLALQEIQIQFYLSFLVMLSQLHRSHQHTLPLQQQSPLLLHCLYTQTHIINFQ